MTATPDQLIASEQCVVWELVETKGVQRRGGSESYLCRDKLLCKLLLRAKSQVKAGEPLVGLTASQFRTWFKSALKKLGLQDRGLQPYSFRRGGITAAVAQGVPASTDSPRALA